MSTMSVFNQRVAVTSTFTSHHLHCRMSHTQITMLLVRPGGIVEVKGEWLKEHDRFPVYATNIHMRPANVRAFTSPPVCSLTLISALTYASVLRNLWMPLPTSLSCSGTTRPYGIRKTGPNYTTSHSLVFTHRVPSTPRKESSFQTILRAWSPLSSVS